MTSEPRKKHSHRCPTCHNAVYCYKSKCALPQRTECAGCKRRRSAMAINAAIKHATPTLQN